MEKLKAVIIIALVLLCHTTTSSAQTNAKPIRFGLITDIQYADAETMGSRFYRNSLKKLDDCIQDFNQKAIPFILNLGDVTDRNPDDLAPVLTGLSKSKGHVYTTPGNHDYTGITDNAGLFTRLNMPSEYYSFKIGNWRFAMLNTNEVASYSNVKGSQKEAELKMMLKTIEAKEGKNAQEYNGGVSSMQLQWLQKLLSAAKSKGENVLIFSHHPVACADGLTALNDSEIIELVSKYKCVKAMIAGHHHAGAFCRVGELPCIVAEGMVETADQNSYGVVELYADKLILTGYGRMTSRSIRFKK